MVKKFPEHVRMLTEDLKSDWFFHDLGTEYEHSLLYAKEAKLHYHEGDSKLPNKEYLPLTWNHKNQCWLKSDTTLCQAEAGSPYKKPGCNVTGCIHLVNNWLEEELAWLPPYLLEMEVGSNANGECTQGLDVRLSQAIYKFQWWMINFVIPSKEDDEQIKSYLRTSIYC